MEDLKEKLSQVAAGGIFFTTIQKFQAEAEEVSEVVDPKLKKALKKGKPIPFFLTAAISLLLSMRLTGRIMNLLTALQSI